MDGSMGRELTSGGGCGGILSCTDSHADASINIEFNQVPQNQESEISKKPSLPIDLVNNRYEERPNESV